MVADSLASPNRSTEDVRIQAVVVPELELIDIERKILAAHFMEGPDNAALHQRPEAFDGLGVDVAMNIFAFAMTHCIKVIRAEISRLKGSES